MTTQHNTFANLKIREHSLKKVPIIAVVGKREAEENTLSLRRLGSDGQEVLGLEGALARLADEAKVPA